MGKLKRGEKEWSREQELLKENKELKKKLSALRKQLSRLDLDRYDNIKEIIEDSELKEEVIDELKKSWLCNKCNKGFLEITVFNKLQDEWYYRSCDHCTHRTKAQRYSKDVKGLMKNAK